MSEADRFAAVMMLQSEEGVPPDFEALMEELVDEKLFLAAS